MACVPWRGGCAWRSGAERVAAIGGRELDSREVVSGEGGGAGGEEEEKEKVWSGSERGGCVCVCVEGEKEGRREEDVERRRKSVCASSAGERGIVREG